MIRKQAKIFSHHRIRTPGTWRRPSVALASLGINLLALALPTVILQVYDRIIPNQATETFLILIVGMLGVVLLDTGLRVFRSLILSWEGARFDHRESLKAMNRVLDSETLAFDAKPPGFYLDKMHALEQIQEFYSGQSVLLMMDFPFVFIFLGLIWTIAGPLILIPLGLLGLFAIVSIWTGRHLQAALEARSRVEERRQNFIIETLRGIHTVKSMAMESFMMRRYEKLQEQSAASVFELSRINSIVQGIGATFSQLAVATFASIGSLFVISGELSIGALAAGTMLSSRVLQPGLKAMGFWTQFQSVRLALRKVDELYALAQEAHGEFHADGEISGAIELDNVSFGFPSQQTPTLEALSLRIEPGEAIGITGGNGAGKTTLTRLLSGFLNPQEGRVLLDGRDIREYQLEVLRSQIGVVPQNGTLFEGTILENMALYREGVVVEHAIELSRQLGLDEIIARLPDGLDTQIGGSAVDTLSEGVRQKIIMIRALVGYPKVMLFDDANANFDIRNDTKFVEVIKRLKGEHTIVVVSHRPSLLRICDRQFLLQNQRLTDISADYAAPGNAVPESAPLRLAANQG